MNVLLALTAADCGDREQVAALAERVHGITGDIGQQPAHLMTAPRLVAIRSEDFSQKSNFSLQCARCEEARC